MFQSKCEKVFVFFLRIIRLQFFQFIFTPGSKEEKKGLIQEQINYKKLKIESSYPFPYIVKNYGLY